jgi:hypothetical protein
MYYKGAKKPSVQSDYPRISYDQFSVTLSKQSEPLLNKLRCTAFFLDHATKVESVKYTGP